jgi:hypothetical protein
MKYSIRSFSKTDYPMIKEWWTSQNEIAPTLGMLPEESTLILELDDKPSLCLTVYLTNCKEVAYLENFVGNPLIKSKERKQASQFIVDSGINFAKTLGYKRILCFTNVDKLKNRYKELGMSESLTNLCSFVKEVD